MIFFPVDVDAVPAQDLEQYKHPNDQIVIQQTVDDYRDRYMDILKSPDGTPVQLAQLNADQAQEFLNLSDSDTLEQKELEVSDLFKPYNEIEILYGEELKGSKN